jgi:hypothetical protein
MGRQQNQQHHQTNKQALERGQQPEQSLVHIRGKQCPQLAPQWHVLLLAAAAAAVLLLPGQRWLPHQHSPSAPTHLNNYRLSNWLTIDKDLCGLGHH